MTTLTVENGAPLRALVTIDDQGDVIWEDTAFKVEMKTKGVTIPASRREEFGNREVIKLGEKDFLRALRECYFPEIKGKTFNWEVQLLGHDPLNAS